MKAVVLEKTCKADELEVKEVPIPKVVKDKVLLKVKGFGINRSEIILRDYEADEDYIDLPVIPGIECIGEIVGPSNSSFKKGDIVACLMGGMGRTFDGSYAEYALIPIKNTFKVRENTLKNLSLEEIISIPETYFTAYGSLYECLNLKSDDVLLIRGATSATGISAIQLAQITGAKIIATSRNQKGIEKLEKLGVDYPIIDDGDICQKVLDIFPEGVEKVLDLIGPSKLNDTIKTLKFRGILCITGVLGGEEYVKNFNPIADVPNGRYLTGFYSNYPTQKIMDDMFDFIIKNNVKPVISAVFNSLEDISKAHILMESNKVQGKIIFKLD
ncbi:hypothetical protein BGI41_00810 [Methanobrevibacter sp. 87.7]|uniref:zinc-binding dehydrogenase n=1 Tax=Methanobrevibacter sp. 87.7 TaxID=387957 RepID=UPI000B72160A|nr:zinc-binding dehydrogenase [Methanobrevibacter sp. 87.7]OWT33737.1 hypothetical protein BGI41_00810 [Methanobrevibacter sp. 87.7]